MKNLIAKRDKPERLEVAGPKVWDIIGYKGGAGRRFRVVRIWSDYKSLVEDYRYWVEEIGGLEITDVYISSDILVFPLPS